MPGGASIGYWESSCVNDILQSVVVFIGASGAAGVADAGTLQAACAASPPPLATATGAANTRCRGELAVTANTPKKKFPGSAELFDYVPTITYVLAGGFIDNDFAAGGATNQWCVFAPSYTAVAARPAGGTGIWSKPSYVNDLMLSAAPILPAGLAGMFINNGAAVGAALPLNGALLQGPLRRLQYATNSTVNYFKKYLPASAA